MFTNLKDIKEHSCARCCIPEGYPNINFYDTPVGKLCEECYKMYLSPYKKEEVEADAYSYIQRLKERRKNEEFDAIFAYSGGRDSTAALYYAIRVLNLRLIVLSYDNGFKGEKTKENIENVLSDLGLSSIHVRTKTQNHIVEDMDANIMPCGRCGSLKVIYPLYCKILNADTVITGIDCPYHGEVVRDRGTFFQFNLPAAFGWTKKEIKDIVRQTVWRDPGYHKYDSDCLIPGVALKQFYSNEFKGWINMMYGVHEQHIVTYYSCYVRYGLCSRDDMFEFLAQTPYISDEAENEYHQLYQKYHNNNNS